VDDGSADGDRAQIIGVRRMTDDGGIDRAQKWDRQICKNDRSRKGQDAAVLSPFVGVCEALRDGNKSCLSVLAP